MPIPKFDETILPFLIFASDGEEHRMSDAVEVLAKEFHLTEDERSEMLPSGSKPKFESRVGWGNTYLKKAHLLESVGKGKFRITDRGRDVLKSKPGQINTQFLRQFPEFLKFDRRVVEPQSSNINGGSPSEIIHQYMNPLEGLTPEEALQMSYQSLRQALAQEILQKVKEMSPRFFESLVVDVLVSMGYGGSRKDAGQVIGKSGDGGIDGIIAEESLKVQLDNYVLLSPEAVNVDEANKAKLERLINEDPLAFIEYWSVNPDYDGEVFRSFWQDYRGNTANDDDPYRVVDTALVTGLPCKKGKRKGCVRVVDVFGFEAEAIQEV